MESERETFKVEVYGDHMKFVSKLSGRILAISHNSRLTFCVDNNGKYLANASQRKRIRNAYDLLLALDSA